MRKVIQALRNQFTDGVLNATTTWRKVYRWASLVVTAALAVVTAAFGFSFLGTPFYPLAIALFSGTAFFLFALYMFVDTYSSTEESDRHRARMDAEDEAHRERMLAVLEDLSAHLGRMDGLITRAAEIADPASVAAARAASDQLGAAVREKKLAISRSAH